MEAYGGNLQEKLAGKVGGTEVFSVMIHTIFVNFELNKEALFIADSPSRKLPPWKDSLLG